MKSLTKAKVVVAGGEQLSRELERDSLKKLNGRARDRGQEFRKWDKNELSYDMEGRGSRVRRDAHYGPRIPRCNCDASETGIHNFLFKFTYSYRILLLLCHTIILHPIRMNKYMLSCQNAPLTGLRLMVENYNCHCVQLLTFFWDFLRGCLLINQVRN